MRILCYLPGSLEETKDLPGDDTKWQALSFTFAPWLLVLVQVESAGTPPIDAPHRNISSDIVTSIVGVASTKVTRLVRDKTGLLIYDAEF